MSRDEELQKQIQDNDLHQVNKDDPAVIAYLSLFRTLTRATEYTMPRHLPEVVIKKLMKRQTRIFRLQEFFWFSAGALPLLIAAVFTATRLEFKIDLGFLNAFTYKGVLVFGILVIAILNYIDRRLIQKNKKSAT